jgi:hypothetical protein
MPHLARLAVFFLAASALVGVVNAYEPPAVPAPAPLRYPEDTFAFKNETVWNYVGGSPQKETRAKTTRQYTQRCFVMSRSLVQFWKFARFDPKGKPLSADDLGKRIREVTKIPVWKKPLAAKDRIVIPGYHNLHEASAAMPNAFQENLGLGWPFYFRAGNMSITFWVSRAMEARLNGEIYHDLQMNTPTILWVYRFPSLKMDHVVVVYQGTKDAAGYHYRVYDPNYRDRYSNFDFDPKTRTFSYQTVYFFKGGPVTVRSIYRGLLQ